MVVNKIDFEEETCREECFEEKTEREGGSATKERSVPDQVYIYDHRGETKKEEEAMMEEALLPLESRTTEVAAGEEDYFCDYYADYKEIASLEEGQPVEVTASAGVDNGIRIGEDHSLCGDGTLLEEVLVTEPAGRTVEKNGNPNTGAVGERFQPKNDPGSLTSDAVRAMEERFESQVGTVRIPFLGPVIKPPEERSAVHVRFSATEENGKEEVAEYEKLEEREEEGSHVEESTPRMAEVKSPEPCPESEAGTLPDEKATCRSTGSRLKGDVTPKLDEKVASMAEPGGSKTGLNRTIGEEKEEFEKELEERLFPLDEVELKKRVKANEEQKKELCLAELSCILGIPEEILVRTRESSPGELSKPEYWIKWYASTLASSEAAKRDFNNAPQDGDTVASVSPSAKGDSDERDVGGGKKKFRRSRKREKERTKKFLVQRDPVDMTV
ncbi:hypothetical protein PHMEG_00033449, partial [Phytophthora megakarya]